MGLKSDHWIRKMSDKHAMISPFEGGLVRHSQRMQPLLSFGTSSYGYDLRVADEFKVSSAATSGFSPAILDPKNVDHSAFVDFKGDVCLIPPHGFALGRSVEYFRIPKNVLGLCVGKSTYARCGINIFVTPLEPGWEGHVTLEFANTTPLYAKIYAHEGAVQVLFLEADEACSADYPSRHGKYHGQRGITLPRF